MIFQIKDFYQFFWKIIFQVNCYQPAVSNPIYNYFIHGANLKRMILNTMPTKKPLDERPLYISFSISIINKNQHGYLLFLLLCAGQEAETCTALPGVPAFATFYV